MHVRRLILDAGHGPHNGKGGKFDPGATTAFGIEHDMVTVVVTGAIEELRGSVNTLRTPELSISQVVSYCNDRYTPGDVLFVLHMNSGGGRGAEVLFADTSADVRRAQAATISAALANVLGIPNRGAKSDSDVLASRIPQSHRGYPESIERIKRGFPILRDTIQPAFILELGFIDSALDVKRVRARGALAVANAYRALRSSTKEQQ